MATYFSEKIKDYEGFETFINDNNIELCLDDSLLGLNGILSNLQCDVKNKIKELNNILNQPYKRLYNKEEEKLGINYFCDGYICEMLKNKYKELFSIIQKHNTNNKENQLISLYNAYSLDKEEEFGIKIDSYSEAINKEENKELFKIFNSIVKYFDFHNI